MERLQMAIEKARASRERTSAALPADLASAVAELPAPAPDQAWAQLEEIQIKPKLLLRNRVVTHQPGPQSLPFDILRTRLVQQARQNGWRRIAVLSPHGASGKSTLVANLAFCLGRQHDLKTLVLDFDLRRPGLARILGQKPRQSMADVIAEGLSFASHGLRFGPNLAFGLNGRAARNPSEVLQGQETAAMLARLDDTYGFDVVLFDMPPLLVTDDTLGFLRQIDAALILVEAERTPLSQIAEVEAQVAGLTNVLGVVLNRCNFTDGTAGSYGYY